MRACCENGDEERNASSSAVRSMRAEFGRILGEQAWLLYRANPFRDSGIKSGLFGLARTIAAAGRNENQICGEFF